MLILCFCRDKALIAIGRSLPAIRILRLYACAHYTDAGLIAVANGCKLLHTLDLCGAHSITDSGIDAIAKGCRRIVWLNLQWCIKLTVSIVDIHCYSPQVNSNPQVCLCLLDSIHNDERCYLSSIHGLTKVSDDGLRALGDGCIKMETIDINGTPCDKTLPHQLWPGLSELVQL